MWKILNYLETACLEGLDHVIVSDPMHGSDGELQGRGSVDGVRQHACTKSKIKNKHGVQIFRKIKL